MQLCGVELPIHTYWELETIAVEGMIWRVQIACVSIQYICRQETVKSLFNFKKALHLKTVLVVRKRQVTPSSL